MTLRRRFLSGNEGEERFGYSQALEVGELIAISGQVSRDNPSGQLEGQATLSGRCARALRNVRDAAIELGGPDAALVSLQVHVTRSLGDGGWDELAAAVSAFSGAERPAVSIVPITTLFSPDYLVEVSAMATSQPRTLVADDGPIGSALGASKAVRVGSQLHIAGHLPVDAGGQVLAEGLIEQFQEVCRRLGETLAQAGGSIADIVSTHIFIAGAPTPEETTALSPAHRAVFGESKPTATLLFVPELPFGARVQISAVAEFAADDAER